MKVRNYRKIILDQLVIIAPFILGVYFIVIRPFGATFLFVPGDLGDARLVNYILEHFYLWVSGFSDSYWNAHFFYPNLYTIAFSENMLGSAPIYAFFRFFGFGMYSAFQAWFLAGYIANYISAVWVLSRFRFGALAVTMGAFFFVFGLPVLAQENHAQLLYRFCIPPAFYCLWRFYQTSKFDQLIWSFFWIVWQFYLCIYTGYFLLMAICIMTAFLFYISVSTNSLGGVRNQWRKQAMVIWSTSRTYQWILLAASVSALLAGIFLLMWPYYHASRLYGFVRNWDEISIFLPRPESYLLADNSLLWSFIGKRILNVSMGPEHQLFTGLAIIILISVGIIFRWYGKNSTLAWVNLWTVIILVFLTLNISGYSLYRFIFIIPGINAIRAVSRMELIWMWPLAVFAAWAMDNLWKQFQLGYKWAAALAGVIGMLMFSESIFYNHVAYNKLNSEVRLERLRQQIPYALPNAPILFVARHKGGPAWALEIDAMLVAQEFHWSTFNGYSGYIPLEYESANICKNLPRRIQKYMETVGNQDENLYLELMERTVVIGFNDCESVWWEKIP